jgi:hypothetical protein
MTPEDLRKLQDLAKLVAETDLARLARTRAKDAALKGEAAQLSNPSRAIVDPEQFRLNVQLGMERKWDTWKQHRLAALQAERAEARVKLDADEAQARQAFGREQVLSALLEQALNAKKKRKSA